MPPAKGYSLLCERLEALPGILRDQLATPQPAPPKDLAERGILATGAGSSEAAARLLVHVLNRAGIPAAFEPLSTFFKASLPHRKNPPYLAVFSQGLSPNVGIPLCHRQTFAGLILFTASTSEGQRQAGKPDRAALLETLAAEKTVIRTHPLENEYTLLPRFIGPVCVQLAVCQFCEDAVPGCLGGNEVLNKIPELFLPSNAPLKKPEAWRSDLNRGVTFFFTNACADMAQNLSYKCMETFMISPPALVDALTYSHGRFQHDTLHPAPHWIFTTSDPDEQQLLAHLAPLFERGGGFSVIESTLPPPLALLDYEAFLNSLCKTLLADSDLDLIDWPGKGEDGPGYQLDQPADRPSGDTP
jgi:hypothetical protein